MGKMQRNKGKRGERLLVKTARKAGLSARRLAPAQVGTDLPDVEIRAKGIKPIKCECKNTESVSNKFWNWLEKSDLVFLKKNQREPLIILTADNFLSLLTLAQNKSVAIKATKKGIIIENPFSLIAPKDAQKWGRLRSELGRPPTYEEFSK